MHFVSYAFVAFFLAVFGANLILQRSYRWQNLLLLTASYVFYGWWDWRFLSLIVMSTVVDFVAGQKLDRERFPELPDEARRRWITLSVVTNLSLLGFFKYFGFFVESAQSLLGEFPLPLGLETLEIDENEVIAAGATAYFSKPATNEVLLEAAEKAIAASRSASLAPAPSAVPAPAPAPVPPFPGT